MATDMQRAVARGRRVLDAVSPVGEIVIVKLKNGNELWFVRKPNGDPDEESIGTIRSGEDGWPVIKRAIERAYGTDDAETWVLRGMARLTGLSVDRPDDALASSPSISEAIRNHEPERLPGLARSTLAVVRS